MLAVGLLASASGAHAAPGQACRAEKLDDALRQWTASAAAGDRCTRPIIVQLADHTATNGSLSLARRSGCRATMGLEAGHGFCAEATAQSVAALSRSSSVSHISADLPVHTSAATDAAEA